jgi:hypothetical protein
MKRLLLAGLAFSALIMPVLAADMPIRALPPPPTWTGLYWGVNAGWIGGSEYNITNTGTDTGLGGLGTGLALGAIPGVYISCPVHPSLATRFECLANA